MSSALLNRSQIVVVIVALMLGACGSGSMVSDGIGGNNAGATGGAPGDGTGGGGPGGMGGDPGNCGVGPTDGAPGFGAPAQDGMGTSTAKFFGGDVTRDGSTYR